MKEPFGVSTLPPIAPEETRSQPPGLIRRMYIRLLAQARYDRIEGSLRVARIDIERRFDHDPTLDLISSLPGDARPEPGWKHAALSLLAEADAALVRGRIDQAWKLLHAARRLEIFGMDKITELPSFSAALRAEAEKLKSWRQKAMQGIVGTTKKPLSGTAAAIAAAALIRDEHYDNQAYKDQLARTQILFLGVILAGVMAGIMGLLYLGHLPLGPELPSTFYSFVGVMLFGNLGGTISAMLRASDTTSSARIPEITSATRVTFMRILMGGASAVIIYLALKSQLTGVFSQELAATMKALTPQTTYVIAFVAGFSERLVLTAVEYVAGKPAAPAPEKGKPAPQT
jgi:hypothetical protein